MHPPLSKDELLAAGAACFFVWSLLDQCGLSTDQLLNTAGRNVTPTQLKEIGLRLIREGKKY